MIKETQTKPENEPRLRLHFATTNKEKIETATRHLEPLGISVQAHSLVIPEIQSDSSTEIAAAKAKMAYSKLRKPVIISDHSWSIPALNGFPGPYMKYMNQWLTSADFLMLMMRHEDKRIIKTEIIVYRDQHTERIFEESLTGNFLQFPQGEGEPAMRVVGMDDSGRSVAECIEEGIDISEDYSIWESFGSWYRAINLQ